MQFMVMEKWHHYVYKKSDMARGKVCSLSEDTILYFIISKNWIHNNWKKHSLSLIESSRRSLSCLTWNQAWAKSLKLSYSWTVLDSWKGGKAKGKQNGFMKEASLASLKVNWFWAKLIIMAQAIALSIPNYKALK